MCLHIILRETMEPPLKVPKVANDLHRLARQLALIGPSGLQNDGGNRVGQLERALESLSHSIHKLEIIEQSDVRALQAIQGTLLLWLNSMFTSTDESSSNSSMCIIASVCDRLKEIYGWSFSTATKLVEKEEQEEILLIFLNVISISFKNEALFPAIGHLCEVLEMVLNVVEFSELASDLKKQVILMLIEAHAKNVCNATFILNYLCRQQPDLHLDIALNAMTHRHPELNKECQASDENHLYYLQCIARLRPEGGPFLGGEMVELMLNNIFCEHPALLYPTIDCLIVDKQNEALFRIFLESQSEQVKYEAMKGLCLQWLAQGLDHMSCDILKVIMSTHFLLVVKGDGCIAINKNENSEQKATTILLTIINGLLSRPRETFPLNDLVAILRTLMKSRASQRCKCTIVETVCQETVYTSVIEKHPIMISDIASVVLEAPHLLTLFVCWLQELMRCSSSGRSLSDDIVRQPMVLTAIILAANKLDWNMRQSVVWILYDLSTYAINWRILVRHPGVLSTMVHFVRDSRDAKLKQRIMQLAKFL